MHSATSVIDLSNEGIQIQQRGILPAIAGYFNEKEASTKHSLDDLLFNLPCIHRTFCLTHHTQEDLFLPLTDCRYVFNELAGPK